MKFLLDMGISHKCADFLRSQDHDAVHLRDEDLQRMRDEDIITKAREEERIILTHDLDFGRIMALSKTKLPSVITFRLQDMRAVNVNHYLSIVIKDFADDLEAGALISANEQAIRVRILPIG